MRTLWIVCPVYRDVQSFLALHDDVRAEYDSFHKGVPERFRFVSVDDTADQDSELARLEGLADIDVLHVPFNLGHQRALVFGLRTLSVEIGADD